MLIAERVAQARKQLEAHPELADDKEYVAGLAELEKVLADNPLQGFSPHVCRWCGTYDGVGCAEHAVPQLDFLRARTRIVAAFAGNRMGKSTGLTVRALIECVDAECLPTELLPFKRWDKTTAPYGTHGRIVNPSFKLLDSVILETFKRWVPKSQLRGGKWDKAYKGAPDYKLSFANGSFIEFMTYDQDEDKFGGSARHFVGYDEPPPKRIRRECQFRTVDYGGYEMFACTPLKVNTAWMRRDIWRKREASDITVVKGSIHDNPTLNAEAKRAALEGDDTDRLAREFGDFVEMGGLIYPDFERRVVDRPSGDLVRGLDVTIGIDPGIRNAAIVFCGFDNDDTLVVFDEALLQDKTPTDYAAKIRETFKRWGIDQSKATFVIDPAARQRNQTNAETVQSALTRLGIYTVNGQNDVDAGVQQLRVRIQHRRLAVSTECRLTRDEADEYAAEDRDDGEFKPIKTANMHILDALRYVAMYQPFDAIAEAQAPKQNLGWTPGADKAPPASWFRKETEAPPMGSMS